MKWGGGQSVLTRMILGEGVVEGKTNWLDELAHIIIERSLSMKFSNASPTLGLSSLSRARTKGSLGPP